MSANNRAQARAFRTSPAALCWAVSSISLERLLAVRTQYRCLLDPVPAVATNDLYRHSAADEEQHDSYQCTDRPHKQENEPNGLNRAPGTSKL
jgi:hypothetical protein